MKKGKNNLWYSIFRFIIWSIIIIAVSSYFVFNNALIGPIFLLLGLTNIFIIKLLKIKIKTVYPDIVFGFVDNTILVLLAILGGKFAGVTGAILGGAAGNSITDGLGGFFEGQLAEKAHSKKDNRTSLSSSFGKTAGCLLGAGIDLTLIWLIGVII